MTFMRKKKPVAGGNQRQAGGKVLLINSASIVTKTGGIHKWTKNYKK